MKLRRSLDAFMVHLWVKLPIDCQTFNQKLVWIFGGRGFGRSVSSYTLTQVLSYI